VFENNNIKYTQSVIIFFGLWEGKYILVFFETKFYGQFARTFSLFLAFASLRSLCFSDSFVRFQLFVTPFVKQKRTIRFDHFSPKKITVFTISLPRETYIFLCLLQQGLISSFNQSSRSWPPRKAIICKTLINREFQYQEL
jgi:hypothetical protein